MRKILAAFVVATLAFPVAAFANHEGKFADMDTNKDGSISKSEAAAHHDMKFDKKDTNKDGMVSKAEFDAAHKNKTMWNKNKAKSAEHSNAADANDKMNDSTESGKEMAR